MTFRPSADPALSARSPRLGPTWTEEDGALLQTLREAARVDEAIFAKNHAISLAQLRALEGRGSAPFYSEAIKARLGQRLLASLGHTRQEEDTRSDTGTGASSAEVWPTPAQPVPAERAGSAQELPLGSSRREPLSATRGTPAGRRSALLALAAAAVIAAGLGLLTRPAKPVAPVAAATPPTAVEPLTLATAPGAAPASSTPPALEPLPAPAKAVPSASSASTTSCGAWAQASAVAPTFTPDQAQRPATYVHAAAMAPLRVCVVDASGQAVAADLKTGEARSIAGKAPFQVQASDPQALRLYFQGQRVPADVLGAAGVVLLAR